MATYTYRAISSEGDHIRGAIEADDYSAARDMVVRQGLFILNIKVEPPLVTSLKIYRASRSVSRKDTIELASNLSVMLRSGMPLTMALADMANLTDQLHLKQVVSDIRRSIENGMRLSDAVLPHRFPHVFVKVIQVGEETGQLDRSLDNIADHLQKMEDLASAIKRALIYPSFAIVATLGALGFWMVFVLPGVMNTMKDLGAKIPPLTRGLMHISNFMKSYWYLIPIVIFALIVFLKLMNAKPKTRLMLHRIKLKTPVLKLILYNKLHAVFSEQLRILLVAGLTITKSLDMLAELMDNDLYKNSIRSVREQVASGGTIATALRDQLIFSPMMVRMVDVGEKSGTLESQFKFLSEYYIKKLDDISQKMGKIIEPLVISVLGIFFALIIGGLLLPVYDLVAKVGKG